MFLASCGSMFVKNEASESCEAQTQANCGRISGVLQRWASMVCWFLFLGTSADVSGQFCLAGSAASIQLPHPLCFCFHTAGSYLGTAVQETVLVLEHYWHSLAYRSSSTICSSRNFRWCKLAMVHNQFSNYCSICSCVAALPLPLWCYLLLGAQAHSSLVEENSKWEDEAQISPGRWYREEEWNKWCGVSEEQGI